MSNDQTVAQMEAAAIAKFSELPMKESEREVFMIGFRAGAQYGLGVAISEFEKVVP